jgi:hypothetical protein
MDSTILELSRYSTTDRPLNAEWTNRLAKPVTIEQGDYISVKNCFIDTRQIDNNSILIEKDINWTFRYIFWVQNTSIVQYTRAANTEGANNNRDKVIYPDGLPYMLVDARLNGAPDGNFLRGKPVVESFVVNIPAGTYERAYFAEYITRQLQGIQTPQNYTFRQNYLSRAQTIPTYTEDSAAGIFTGFTEQFAPDASNNPVTSFVKPMYFGSYNGQGGGEVGYQQMMFTKYVYNGQGTEDEYAPVAYVRMTGGQNYNIHNDDLMSIANNNIVTNGFTWYNMSYAMYDGTLIGASQISFVYNDNGGDNRFSFQYLHTPLMTGAASGTSEVVGTCVSSGASLNIIANRIQYLNASSGIMFVDTFTDGDTEQFMNQLGFTYNDLVPSDVAAVFQFSNNCLDLPNACTYFDYNNSFLPYTTRNKLTVGNLSTVATTPVGNGGTTYQMITNESIYSQNQAANAQFFNFADSQVTDDIVAKNPPISSSTNAGHYLIEITDGYTSTYINQDKLYNIKAIVGNYFLSGDSYAQSLGNDSYIYQHTGVSSTLNSLHVRILNPITKEPELNLGPNSTIYLQITKEPPQPQQEQEQTPHK